ncbi:MAG TPA: nucleotide pyrophosphohydrolase [Acidilobales archaeon]|nr:MAG: nucleotide pyrophosphohydrolase [Desulfurococcales archaeon ex4484_42]HDD25957.1 nucleotide pyrophosphohydrolase [Acidilobales archaeon]
MEIKEAQELIREEFYETDSKRGLYPTFTWFVEEVGELAEALLSGKKELIEDEVADVFAWLLSIANLLDINVEEVFKKKYVDGKYKRHSPL